MSAAVESVAAAVARSSKEKKKQKNYLSFPFSPSSQTNSPSRLAIVTDLKAESGKRPRRCATWKTD